MLEQNTAEDLASDYSAVSDTQPHDTAITSVIDLSSIAVVPGHNPRRHFDEAAMKELVESIQAQGLIQPIAVRPNGQGGYFLVAGERRFRAASLAGLTSIPALIRQMTAREALAAAVAENAIRKGISIAEESQVARQAIDLAEGDESEAARTLGWSTAKLKARLLLLNATQEVLDAQMTGVIKIGHAELLSSLPHEKQAVVLGRVLSSDVSVEELKKQLASFTQDLGAAPFNITACTGCPHNSTTQASLFDQNVGQGRCSNRTCWTAKTEDHLSAIKVEKATEFNVVWFDREKSPETHTKLTEGGASGVGSDQIAACKGCGHNGALICTAPGKEGKVAPDVCFDLTCHGQKVSLRLADLAAHQKAAAEQISKADSSAAPIKTATAKSPAEAPKKVESSKTATVAAAPKRLIAIHNTFYRETAAKAMAESATLQIAADLYGLYRACDKTLPNVVKKMVPSHPELRHFMLLSPEDAAIARKALQAALIGQQWASLGASDIYTHPRVTDAAAAIAITQTPTKGAFKLDKPYLEALTKSMIEALLVEACFVESMEGESAEDKQKAFRKFIAQGRAELIDAVLASKHDFTQFVPKALIDGLRTALGADKSVLTTITALRSKSQ